MSRPHGSKNKKTLAKQAALLPVVDKRTDAEIVEDISTRFDIFYEMICAAAKSVMNALIVSGSAGVGKSYTAEWALAAMTKRLGTKYTVIRGAVSAIGLYEIAYANRHPGTVVVLDDSDSIFQDEDGLNILKSLLDTSLERKIGWHTDHHRFKDGTLPKEFIFNGSMVFLTNKDFQRYIDNDIGKNVPHMEALMSRSIYLSLKMYSRREVSLWVQHLVKKNHILQQIGTAPMSAGDENMLLDWLVAHRDDLRELSIRTAIKLGKLYLMDQENWKSRASMILLREIR